jgi:hypothetical protein
VDDRRFPDALHDDTSIAILDVYAVYNKYFSQNIRKLSVKFIVDLSTPKVGTLKEVYQSARRHIQDSITICNKAVPPFLL